MNDNWEDDYKPLLQHLDKSLGDSETKNKALEKAISDFCNENNDQALKKAYKLVFDGCISACSITLPRQMRGENALPSTTGMFGARNNTPIGENTHTEKNATQPRFE